MFAALKQFFMALTAYFIAFEKTGNAAVNVATWADEASGAFADKARQDREVQQLEYQTMYQQKLAAAQSKQKALPKP